MMMDGKIDRVKGTKTVHPTFSHLFREGDRVYCYYNYKRYSGEVVEVIRDCRKTLEKDRPEILMRTYKWVDITPQALLGGYGLRGSHHLFNFEGETQEEEALHTRWVEIPLTPDDFERLEEERALEKALYHSNLL